MGKGGNVQGSMFLIYFTAWQNINSNDVNERLFIFPPSSGGGSGGDL
jgi:hypothetical protein